MNKANAAATIPPITMATNLLLIELSDDDFPSKTNKYLYKLQ